MVADDFSKIVAAKIHPAIGVARVGNSDEFFIGPETVNPPRVEAGNRRDRQGKLKRQAARFRVYGYDASGQVVAEITADNASVTWEVAVANLKAQWYEFQIALDIPEAATADPAKLRNAKIGSRDREKLAIRGGCKAIAGPNAGGPDFTFVGKFFDDEVYLGELKTDDAGRLIFLGGHGRTGHAPNSALTDFANNDGWHDDVSDGPVRASVKIEGREIPVAPSWVVVAPPNYAPDLKSTRTMYDVLTDIFVKAGHLSPPDVVHFERDILPVFLRLSQLQWVNAGFATAFGFQAPFDFETPTALAKLADASDGNKAWRFMIANAFRDPSVAGADPSAWPWLYGDAVAIRPFGTSSRQFAALTDTQRFCLKKWAEGHFVSEPRRPSFPSALERVPVGEQPALLDRAVLEFCLADAFHPGCEMTWPMRHATLYSEPYRIRHRSPDEIVYPIGPTLTSDRALAYDGPLYGQLPGGLTRWMAVPWHADTASCLSQSEYDPSYAPFSPTFWPAHVPNQVLTLESYETVIDGAKTLEERRAAFASRVNWLMQALDKQHPQIEEMLERFSDVGLVEARPGPTDGSDFPSVIYASDGHRPDVASAPAPRVIASAPRGVDAPPLLLNSVHEFRFRRRT
jgi:L-Lysine epsilon oxidase N-terminal/L-lysine epsilon oxidase C-terminal domain